MILTQEQRIALGEMTPEEVTGKMPMTEEECKKWKSLQEAATYLSEAEQVSISFESQAIRLLNDEKQSSFFIGGMLWGWLDRAVSYAEFHPFNHPRLNDPLIDLRHIARTLDSLAKTTKKDFGRNPKQAKLEALAAMGRQTTQDYVEEEFERCFRNGFEAKRREMLVELASRCRGYQAVARMRIDALIERTKWDAEAEAQALETKAEEAESSGDLQQKEKCEREANKTREVTESQIAQILGHVQNIEKGVMAVGHNQLNTMGLVLEGKQVGTAILATITHKNAEASDGDFVVAFHIADQMIKDSKNEGKDEREVIAGEEGVLAQCKSKGLLPNTTSLEYFIKLFHGWRALGCPPVATYIKIHEALKRRPDATAAHKFMKRSKKTT